MTRVAPKLPPRLAAIAATLAAYGFSQRAVCRLAKVSQPHLSNLLAGKHTPGDGTLTKIEKALATMVKRAERTALPPRAR